ncbi:odorant receptor 94b-like [Bradysia coprophila]|uniref:odorant receptor 94b-like n=1 Tax=Bradysia coprophila TaxID=38358 RepID=UPI00187D95D1|nr:odorant receptor 94b-like [Bradysia coprophila]
MYRIEVHSNVQLIVSLLYKFGLWQRDRTATAKERLFKWIYSLGFFSVFISFSVGACKSGSIEVGIFLAQSGLAAFVLRVKLNFLIWKGAEILHLLNAVCIYTTTDHKSFTMVTDKMKNFTTFITVLITVSCFTCFHAVIISPFLAGEKALFFDIAFPLDHKNDEFAFWIAYVYLTLFAMVPAMNGMIFNVLMWYLLYSYALRYKLFEHQVANIGNCALKQNLSSTEKNRFYSEDLTAAIRTHANSRKIADQLRVFFSRIFITSFVTSGVGICGSLYCLVAFHRSTNVSAQLVLLAILLYSVFDVFMLTYFGNEIKMSSDRFTYCLFKSNWIEMPQSTKKSVLIFGEILIRPYEILVFKIFPLSLETFTRILKSAYSMFNILNNFK